MIGIMKKQDAGTVEDRQRPKYTVKAVSRATDLKAATLRAWEKRYGVPAPGRTPSRYRLYSDDDLDEIHWMKARVDEGIPPRQAARLAAERRETGVPFDNGTASLETAALIADLKAFALAFDEDRAQDVLRRAAGVMRPTDIMRNVLLPTVSEIGRGWEAGLVTVAQEHFASQTARRYAGRLMDLYAPSTGVRPVLCACAPGEQHELGILAVAIEVRSRGFPVIYLGPDVPVDALLSSAGTVCAGLAVIAVTLPEHMAALAAAREAVGSLEQVTGAQVLWAGPIAHRAGDHGLPGRVAGTIEEAVAEIIRTVRGQTGSLS
jgi:DNA-binding transcriptional MerR regulator